VNGRDIDGNTCLLEVSLMGHVDIVSYLLSLEGSNKIDINYVNN
jgi:hypothetical protein